MPFLKTLHQITYSRTKNIDLSTEKNGIHALYYTRRRRKGDWINDKKERLGNLFWENDKYLYEGDWKCNIIDGFGTKAERESFSGIYKLDYRGQWANNKKNGLGWQIYPNGDIYYGEFKNNKRWGFGRLYFPDGGYYIGGFENDMKHGYGVLYMATTGNRYEGYFECDLKHGPGTLIYNLTGQIFRGVWYKDIFKCGSVEDYCSRQNAKEPTPYPIPPLKLMDYDKIDQQRREKILEGHVDNDCNDKTEGKSIQTATTTTN